MNKKVSNPAHLCNENGQKIKTHLAAPINHSNWMSKTYLQWHDFLIKVLKISLIMNYY